MPRTLRHGPQRRTHPLVWFLAVICTIIAVAIIIAGMVVFVGYLVIHPRVPFISVANAHLHLLDNDLAGLLQTQISVTVRAENDNQKADATFSDIRLTLSFQGIKIAYLVAGQIEVSKKKSMDLNYVVQSSSIPLNPDQMDEVDFSRKRNVISFELKGSARAMWRVGPLGSVKFWNHLNCMLKFHPSNGTYIHSRCSSKSK
ncbi:Late embryogenesis abundant protein [Quillaja saponaria]|uniref:Late embryogenesis abundant protein n=1 Tax=Quillaja saponaria TaxID=32244 RepID=A0AAD7L801_QUISA|nr:Late embryogenesis abundant protein [Quillaja saponaria]